MPSLRITALVAALVYPAAPAAQPARAAPEITWLGLYTDELVSWLENENRLPELCTAGEASEEWHACRGDKLQPKIDVVPVHSESRPASRRLGELVIIALPGNGLKAFVSAGGRSVQFTPDLHDPDWGYGPWFHQTVLERRGGWFRLALPSIGAGWIDVREGEHTDARLRRLEAGDIVSIADGDVVFLGIDQTVLRFRPEQEADMWCDPGPPPAVSPSQEMRIPLERLRGADGRLRISYKYTRGC